MRLDHKVILTTLNLMGESGFKRSGGCITELVKNLLMSYFGHLSLDPTGLQGCNSFLCCRWTVKVHKAISCQIHKHVLKLL